MSYMRAQSTGAAPMAPIPFRGTLNGDRVDEATQTANDLMCIGGFVEELLSGEAGPLTPRQREYLEVVYRRTMRLSQRLPPPEPFSAAGSLS
jgi:hypothetical protein